MLMEAKMTLLQIRIEDELKKKIKIKAAVDEVSITDLIIGILEKSMDSVTVPLSEKEND